MSEINKTISEITDNTESLVKDYLQLISLKLAQKVAFIFAFVASLLVISVLVLIVIIFGSIALSIFLNNVLESELLGFLIMGGIYILAIVFILLKTDANKKPLFIGMFVKFILSFFEIEIKHKKSMEGLQFETEKTELEIDNFKDKIRSDLQFIPYIIWNSVVNEVIVFFAGKKKNKKQKQSKKKSKNQVDSDEKSE